jgi:hypothetical protein
MRNIALYTALVAALVGAPDPTAQKVQGPDTIGNLQQVQLTQPGASVLAQSPVNVSGAAANATLTLTMPAVVGQTNYVTGFELTVGGATAATSLVATMTNIQGGTQSWLVAVPATPASSVNPFTVEFTYPLKATATNTAVVFSFPAAGAGNTNVTGAIHGFTQ